MSRLRPFFLVLTVLAAAPSAAAAEESAVGVLEGSNVLATFSTATPGTFTSLQPITGLASPGERVVAIDYRHRPTAAAALYALTVAPDDTTIRLYTLDPGNAEATPVGPSVVAATGGARWDIDVNPAVDRIRVVNSGGGNLRLNPTSGALAGSDTTISPPGSVVTGVAYDRAGGDPATGPVSTTLLAIDAATAQLGTLGGVNSVPSPNGGVFTAVGALGVTPDSNTSVAFDIPTGAHSDTINPLPQGIATITSAGVQQLYAIDLSTGGAAALGIPAARLGALALLPDAGVSLGTLPFAFVIPTPQAVTVAESAGTATLRLVRSGVPASTIPVAWATSLGQTGTVTFARGQSETTFTVPVTNDTVDEPDEVVTVRLTSAGAPFVFSTEPATITITDDDPAPAAVPAPTSGPVPDVFPPVLKFTKAPASITYADLTKKGAKVTVTTNEPAKLEASLLGTARGVRLQTPSATSSNLTVATAASGLAAGPRTLTLKVRTKTLRRPSKTVTLRARVTATDAAGNRTSATVAIRLKPR